MMNILILCFIWGVVAVAWDLIMGVAGIFTFGQVAFYVIGAYASAILTRTFGISPWLGILAGGLITGGIGILVALPCIRLKGSYVALVTFAVHMILEPFLKSNIGRAIGTGGPQGILTIPPLKLFGYTYDTMELVPWFYTVFVISLISLLIVYKIIHSNWGLAFVNIRDSELFARSIGINDFKYKLFVFGISAFLTGMIGAVYAHYVGVLSPRILGLDLFLILMVMLVLGGIGNFPGALIGAFITVFISEWLRPLETYRNVVFGAMVVLLVIFMPQGITGLLYSIKKTEFVQRIKQYGSNISR
ncbi:MAG: branched-chain amino acid ABC transporter permease [Desulfobacula sp.]|nr:branched-chain amino acid ABC transporter permease [Desulfobacula sp.]